jgi:hypothetical protein
MVPKKDPNEGLTPASAWRGDFVRSSSASLSTKRSDEVSQPRNARRSGEGCDAYFFKRERKALSFFASSPLFFFEVFFASKIA